MSRKIHSWEHKIPYAKQEKMRRTPRMMRTGETPMYYEPGGKPIIVVIDSKEYYFKSSKEAKEKLNFGDSKLKKIKRDALNESKDDFHFDLDTGLYWREVQK